MAALTLARAYQYSFDTHPNSTLALMGGSLNALGDAMAQFAQMTVSLLILDAMLSQYHRIRTNALDMPLAWSERLRKALQIRLPKNSKVLCVRYGNKYVLLDSCADFILSSTSLPGPIMGRWNRILERRFPLRSLNNTGRVSITALSKRVACDQLVM